MKRRLCVSLWQSLDHVLRGILAEWDVAGPVVAAVRGPTSVKPHLIFTFTPREATSQGSFPLRIAVDPDTAETDMLR